MSLIPDHGFHRSNVAPCLLALHFHGGRVAEDSDACSVLLATICGCGQSWAREALAKGLASLAETFLRKPWGVTVLDVAICYSQELCVAVQWALFRQARRCFSDMDNESLYRAGWMSMRMAIMAQVIPDIVCMQEIMEMLSRRLSLAATGGACELSR